MTSGEGGGDVLNLRYHLQFEILYGLAAVCYFLPSFGYVLFDICTFAVPSFSHSASNAFTVSLATVLMIDSLFFLVGYYLYDRPLWIFWSAEMWGELSNVIGSVFLLISQPLYYLTSDDFSTLTTIGWHWGVWYWLAYVSWAVSAVLYFKIYFNERKRGRIPSNVPVYKQLAFWDEVLNTVASFGYVGVSFYGLIPLGSYVTAAAAAADPVSIYNGLQLANFKDQARAALLFDALWTLGGVVNILSWWNDGTNHFHKKRLNAQMSSNI